MKYLKHKWTSPRIARVPVKNLAREKEEKKVRSEGIDSEKKTFRETATRH